MQLGKRLRCCPCRSAIAAPFGHAHSSNRSLPHGLNCAQSPTLTVREAHGQCMRLLLFGEDPIQKTHHSVTNNDNERDCVRLVHTGNSRSEFAPEAQLPITLGLPSAFGCKAMTFSRKIASAQAINVYASGRHRRERRILQSAAHRTIGRRGWLGPTIGIGGSLAAPPLPHHRTYGSVYGGSRSYANALRSRTGDRAI